MPPEIRVKQKRKKVVLVIDDNPGDAQLVAEAFELLGSEVVIAAVENVPQAFTYLQRRDQYRGMPAPDLILLDLNMPIYTGYDFLRELKDDPVWRVIPVVVFTSSRREADRRLAGDLGAKRFLSKPAAWPEYVDAIRTIAAELEAVT